MYKRRLITAILTAWIIACVSENAVAQSLVTDFSRSELGRYGAAFDDTWRAFPYPFAFPENTRDDAIFGIDVSHYEGTIDWKSVPSNKVVFAYVKASQGEKFFDKTFQRNWKGISSQKNIYRGAYHFMTAQGDPIAQANNFLSHVGKSQVTDLPPSLDLEWDFKRNPDGSPKMGPDGKPIDAWADLKPDEIKPRVSAWLAKVEQESGKKPIIYTNYYWWTQRLGETSAFQNYKIWVADYSKNSRTGEEPNMPSGYHWAIWQFTDSGRLMRGGISGQVDVSVFKGSENSFRREFGLPAK